MNHRRSAIWLLLAALLVTTAVYWPGLSGSWLFDDYPNIVDNPGVQPHAISIPALARAALSSPASEFKRPLASLSFAANYLADGLDPFDWKLTNLVLHLLNGCLVFVLAQRLLRLTVKAQTAAHLQASGLDVVAALVAAGWMLLPLNLSAVLYVVQREESMANLFVLLGLVGYVAGRMRMLSPLPQVAGTGWANFLLCASSLILCTATGLLAKETAVMLPLYACLLEWIMFGFRDTAPASKDVLQNEMATHRTYSEAKDWRILALFTITLVLPGIAGLAWLLPSVLDPAQWATRDFTLGTRLLSETRIVCDYIAWTLLPTPDVLSFYHDQFPISTGLLTPWTTLAGMVVLVALASLAVWWRKQRPLVSLGIVWFLGCQLLTGTILPLELVYEHRNYFASFGVMLAVVPWLAGWRRGGTTEGSTAAWIWPRRITLVMLVLWWGTLTALTAYAWGDPLRLAQELATRAPDSPRAQYELGRTYIIYSHYDPDSPYTRLAYAPLERAASFPESSILPQQALIFMNSRMGLPLKASWWDSMIAKLKARDPGVQDESSLGALVRCARDNACPLPTDRMVAAFQAALSHPHPSARLQAIYGDYAWNVLDDHALGLRMIAAAVAGKPLEPAYHITLARMLAAQGRYAEVERQIKALQALNIGGRLDRNIAGMRALVPAATVR
jgi:protein O-mannosyl-transferase